MMAIRLDLALVECGICKSRTQAQEFIRRGEIKVNGIVATKSSMPVEENALLESSALPKYVSRGGEKLENAIQFFKLNLEEKFCLDVGASTGGFTDCMLAHGARRVISIDVGQNQFSPKLKENSQVEWYEKMDIRTLPDTIRAMRFDFIAVDLSFISLSKVLPCLFELVANGGFLLALIKPQFEAGREHVGKNGIVRNPVIRAQCVEKIALQISNTRGWRVIGTHEASPHGSDGNIEYFICSQKSESIIS